jgi:AbrB family looped-hinge helix DNA binding protein
MSIVTVSDKGQVVIPAAIRKQLGITPGCQLSFSLEGSTIRIEIKHKKPITTIEQGFGMLVCPPGQPRYLNDFDIAQAMRDSSHDRH